jgi:hypothetical protein
MGYGVRFDLGGMKPARGRPGQIVLTAGFLDEGHEAEIPPGAIPATLALVPHPRLAPVRDFDRSLEQLPLLNHSISVPGFASAFANARRLSEEYHRRYQASGARAVGQLLSLSEYFDDEDWVQAERRNDPEVRRLLGPRVGRPAGSSGALSRDLTIAKYARGLTESTGQSLTRVSEILERKGRLGIGARRIRQICHELAAEIAVPYRSSLFFLR